MFTKNCKCTVFSWGLALTFTFVVFYSTAMVQATTISLNFVGTGDPLGSTDTAGIANSQSGLTTFVANWNNVESGSNEGGSGSAANLLDSDGNVTAVSASWVYQELTGISNVTGGNNILLPGGNAGDGMQNPKLMKGYIGATGTGTATVTFSNLPFTSYSVVVYADGSAGDTMWNQFRSATYSIGATSYTLRDSTNFNSGDGRNPNGLFQLPTAGGDALQTWPASPNNNEGNYLVFSGLTGSTFTLSVQGFQGVDDDPNLRGPINGIQVIGVPEPSTLLLLATGLLGLLAYAWRRRK